MHKSISNLIEIKKKINSKNLDLKLNPKIIAVSKTFPIEHIKPLIDYGHNDFGENKVQEALDKWAEIKANNKNINLHMIGKLQTNKVKLAVKLFDYIHSVDSIKLARKISEEQDKINRSLKIFIQVNVAKEDQKSGITFDELSDFYKVCVNDLKINIIGLMCLPPANTDPSFFFEKMKKFSKNLFLTELSMGMSSDYLIAAENSATYLRIGSSIFGERS